MDSISYKGDLTCSLSVKDLERAIKWYHERMGFEVIYKLDDMGWCELRTPIETVTVGLSQTAEPIVPGGATLVWGVKDIAAARSFLEAKGVRFLGDTVTIEGMVKLATFQDPDGNRIMFSQNLQTG